MGHVDWQFGVLLLLGMLTPVTAQSVGIGANFRASNLEEGGMRPPDTMGAVGPSHIMLLINGRYELYSKNPSVSGNKDDAIAIVGHASNLNGFWSSHVGMSDIVNFAFDPRVTYDPMAERWYAVSVDGHNSTSSGYLFAVSKSSDPTYGWHGFDIDADEENKRWGDFPMLGFDGKYVYLSAVAFQLSSGGSKYPLYAFPKSDLLAVTPTIDNLQLMELDSSNNQVVRALDNLAPDTQPYHLWEEGNNGVETNTLTEVDGVLTNTPGFINFSTSTSNPSNARQPDASRNLETDNDRFSSRVVRIGGSYWGVFTRKVSSDNVIRWFEIAADTLDVRQDGLITIPGQDLYFPSIAVNDDGDAVIGFSASGPGTDEFISAYAAVGRPVDGITTFQIPQVLKQGVDNYQNLANSRNRWGDYSNTVVDPADPNIFWTFQEWASGEDDWSIQTTELIVAGTDEFYWASDFDGSFTNGLLWSDAVVPGAGDHAIFSRTGIPFVVTMTTDITNQRLSVRQGEVIIDLAGQVLTLTESSPDISAVSVAEFQGTGSLTVNGGGMLAATNVQIGSDSAGEADLTIAGDSHAQISQALEIYGGSSVNLNGGMLEVEAIDLIDGGTLSFSAGELSFSSFDGDLLNPIGTVSLGNPVGVVSLSGSYTQLTGGTMAIEVGGVIAGSFDAISIGEIASLGGTLEVTLIDDFVPSFGDRFEIITAASVSGQFNTLLDLNLEDGLAFGLNYGPTTVSLEVIFPNLTGDADNDGMVHGSDLITVLQNFGNVGVDDGLLLGDANDDGQVSGGDLIVVQQYFGKMLAPISSGVPEPLTLTWLAMGAILMLLCRPVCPSVRS